MEELKPIRPPTGSMKIPPDLATTKRRIVMALIVYSFILGPIFAFLPEEGTPLDTLAVAPLLVLAVAWCLFDARERQHRVGCIMKILLIFVFVVGFPVYCKRL